MYLCIVGVKNIGCFHSENWAASISLLAFVIAAWWILIVAVRELDQDILKIAVIV